MLETLQETRSTAQAIVARSGREISLTKGKKHALKKYDQFALNTSCFLGICANSRNFWYKKIE